MALQLSAAVRNARLDAFTTVTGASAVMKIRTGAAPTDVATADSGTVVATITLPATWMNAATGGAKTLAGTWTQASADATGTAAHFRIYTSGGTAEMQGTVTATGGGGDLTLDSVSIVAGQSVTITTFTLTDGNA